jgi:hypothetical protein
MRKIQQNEILSIIKKQISVTEIYVEQQLKTSLLMLVKQEIEQDLNRFDVRNLFLNVILFYLILILFYFFLNCNYSIKLNTATNAIKYSKSWN